MSQKIGVIVGSLRRESFNRKIANVLIQLAPPSLNFQILEIGDLPIYNQDFDDHGPTPPSYLQFREQIKSCDGFLFVTPEYNRSIPGVLKNAIDVASRPHGQNSWDGKPAAVVSVSTGAMGGFGANQHLRQSLVFVNVPTMQQPEAYIGKAAKLFDEKGQITNEDTLKFLKSFMESFRSWVQRLSPTRSS
jgi:chromate reductase